jgi:hypothetical protein
VGNTIHWIEKQGACDDSVTQQTVSKLINSTKELGGWVVKTGDEFIDWLKKQVSEPEETGSGISPEMALRLSKVFGRTPEGWLRLQLQYDLWKAKQNVDIAHLERIAA